jgi:aryl-phospho-beta-D-glucosidase BglC (GH1 family)
MKPQILLLATALLLGYGLIAPAAEPTLVAPQATNGLVEPAAIFHRPSQLQTRGNRIVNANLEIVRFKGLMIPDPGRLAGEGRYTRALFEAVRATGANVIRIPVHPQFWVNDTNYLPHYLDPAVKWAGELGLYVILDWHSIGNEMTGYAPQVPELFCHTDAMTTNFWAQVAAHFRADPQVVFEIFNEPQNISAADWQRCAGRLAGVIRAQGATQLIIVGGLNYGRELDWVRREPVAGDNLAYASHIFPSHPQSGWNHDFGNVAARYPVVITEWGYIDKQETPNPPDHYPSGDASTYGNPLMSYLDERGIGWVACWYDEQWQPAMLLKSGAGYTAWGKHAARELKNGRAANEP